MNEKHCPKCDLSKPLDAFRRSRDRGDGRDGYCKACRRRYNVDNAATLSVSTKQYYQDNKMRERAKSKAFRQTEIGKISMRKSARLYRERYPERAVATIAISCAVRFGRLIKPELCTECQEAKPLDGHHNDYSKPLDVRWLCRQCHTDHHMQERSQ